MEYDPGGYEITPDNVDGSFPETGDSDWITSDREIIEETPDEPVVEEAQPASEDSAPEIPVIEEAPDEPAVEEAQPAPEDRAPEIPVIEETQDEPAVEEAQPAPEDRAPEIPVIEETQDEPAVEEAQDEPEDRAPEIPVIEETQDEPAVEEAQPAPEDRAPEIPVIEEAQNDPQAEESDLDLTREQESPLEIVPISDDEEIKLDDLRPNAIYQKNDYTYQTDEWGRPVLISGQLELEEGTRSPQQTEIGKLGEEGDEGGHLIATRFDGPPDAFNIVPQNANLNRGEWKSMENEWAEALTNGSEVEVAIEAVHGDDSIRPARFEVVYQIDGEIYQKVFENKASEAKD